MAYTEKVSISGTALSFLLYECINSKNGQEGFLIGDITSEVTNHISDSHSDNARLDTQIVIRTVLPLPSVSLFYCPTGRIKEDMLADMLSNSASEVVGWYKYRKNSNIKPTFRDRLISKGLQKYFERHHNKKTFVSCSLSNKSSVYSSTHTFMYRFGKINSYDMYEYIEDVTGNLGEKVSGYKKPQKCSPHNIFNKIVKESNVQNENISEAILHIQETVSNKLASEARVAVKHEKTIRELEAEIRDMTAILSERQSNELQAAYEELIECQNINSGLEMATACVEALNTPFEFEIQNNVSESNHIDHNETRLISPNTLRRQIDNTSSKSKKPTLNYAAALKAKTPAHTNSNSNRFDEEDLITFDVDEKLVKKLALTVSDDSNSKFVKDSSPEY